MAVLMQTAAVLEMFFVLGFCQNDIREPPSMPVTEPSHEFTRYYVQNQEVLIKCRANGIPQPTYKWWHNRELIEPNESISWDSLSGDLTFPRFSRREEGTYVCLASNQFDNGAGGRIVATRLSNELTLYMIRLDPFVQTPDVSVNATEFSYVRLECSNKGEVVANDTVYSWYQIEEDNVTKLSLDGGRLFIDQDANLHFSYVLRQDSSKGSMKYVCGYSSSAAGLTRLGNGNFLNVEPVNNPTPIKPQLQYSNRKIEVDSMVAARLECFFSGYDLSELHIPTTRWYDRHGRELKYGMSDDHRVLVTYLYLSEVEEYFFCEAENSAGLSSKEAVYVNNSYAPILRDRYNGLRDKAVIEDEDVKFQCDTTSAPGEEEPEEPIWYLNGQRTGSHLDPSKFMVSDDKKILTIKKVKKATDIMCVQCEVSNRVGTTFAQACLNVFLPIKLTRVPSLYQTIQKGQVVDLTVLASADPSQGLQFLWKFNNTIYTGMHIYSPWWTFNDKIYPRVPNYPPYVSYDYETHTTSIDTGDLTDEEYVTIGGIYERIIYGFGQRVVQIKIVLKDVNPVSRTIMSSEACTNATDNCTMMYTAALESSNNDRDEICSSTKVYLQCMIDGCGMNQWDRQSFLEFVEEEVEATYPDADCVLRDVKSASSHVKSASSPLYLTMLTALSFPLVAMVRTIVV